MYPVAHEVHWFLLDATQPVQWESDILQQASAFPFRKILYSVLVIHAEHAPLLTAQAEQSVIIALSQHLVPNSLYPVAHVVHLSRTVPSQSMQWVVVLMAQQ